jgi:hypothetical protein
MASCGSENQCIDLLVQIYGHFPSPRFVGHLTREEHDLLRDQKELFLRHGSGPAFVAATAVTLQHDWPALRVLLHEVLQSLPTAERSAAFRALVEGVYRGVEEADPARLPPDLGEWLLDQILSSPELEHLGADVAWHLEELSRRLGPVPVAWLRGALEARSALEASQDGATGVRAFTPRVRLGRYVKRIVGADLADTSITEAACALLDLVWDDGSVGFHLPEILRDIDPEGLVIPAAVAERLQSTVTPEQAQRLARIAGAYHVGSRPWRTIAKVVLSVSALAGVDARRQIFGALADLGLRTWSGRPGEVSTVFVSAVQSAKASLDSEQDAALRPFWEWRLEVAQVELRDEEERAKEERGE